MKNKIILGVLILWFCGNYKITNAQLPNSNGISFLEISSKITALIENGDESSKLELYKVAKELSKSNNERLINLAIRAYASVNEYEKVKEIEKSILKKFPYGFKARAIAYDKIKIAHNSTGIELENIYSKFLKKFPAENFELIHQSIYSEIDAKLALKFFQENNEIKGNQYLMQIRERNKFSYASKANIIAKELIDNDQYNFAFPILEKAIKTVTEDKTIIGNYLKELKITYAKAKYYSGNYDIVINTISDLFNSEKYTSDNFELNLMLAKSYIKLEKSLDAFLLLENYSIANGRYSEMDKLIEILYKKLNNENSNYKEYSAKLDVECKVANLAKYKTTMIKKKAPEFSLMNMDGKTVSLHDYKGKIIILDFWATWCGPCKQSFPGMQVAVNKYKNNKDIEFLFVNTAQKESNYKELVKNFISENNYTFNVIFDEMQDRNKAMISSYNVTGLPTKIIVDKDGYIRFHNAGGTSEVEKIVNEIDIKIELILNE